MDYKKFYVTVLLQSVEIIWAIESITYDKQDFDVESSRENQWKHCDVSVSVYINVMYVCPCIVYEIEEIPT